MTGWPALKAANDRIHAFVDWDEGAAGGAGLLAGLTVGVKANLMVKGLPWTAGMGLYRHRIAVRDAEAVARLRAAGAKVLGMLNMQEAALGAHNANPFFGTTHNPHRFGHTPGGSSGGSGAAVAAGLCDIALGTDTMGSVRIPAAYCGVYGLKPTNGVVSNDGLAMLEPSLDCIGPLARDLDTLEAAWRVLCVPRPAPLFSRALVLDRLAGVETDCAAVQACDAAVAASGLAFSAITLPAKPGAIRRAGLVQAGLWLIGELGADWRADNADLSEELKGILGWCEGKEPDRALLAATKAHLCAALGTDGVLIMPTAPQPAFAHGSAAPANQADFTCLANIAGLPALSLPAGWSADGLPLGVQLVGPAGSEAALFDLARRIDSRLQAYRPPPIFGT